MPARKNIFVRDAFLAVTGQTFWGPGGFEEVATFSSTILLRFVPVQRHAVNDLFVGPGPAQSIHLENLLGAFSLRRNWISCSNVFLFTIPRFKSAILPSRSISNVTGNPLSTPNCLAKPQSPITIG